MGVFQWGACGVMGAVEVGREYDADFEAWEGARVEDYAGDGGGVESSVDGERGGGKGRGFRDGAVGWVGAEC